MDNETEGHRGPGRPRLARADDGAPMRKPVRERKRKGTIAQDKFAIPAHLIPDGSTYEWKRKAVYGANDPSYDVMVREQGWEPVDVSRHPEFMPPGWKGAIEREGQVLMERPVELTEEARAEERQSAKLAVWTKEAQLGQAPDGQFARTNKGAPMASIHKSYEPIAVE
jgi:hypothetical protein